MYRHWQPRRPRCGQAPSVCSHDQPLAICESSSRGWKEERYSPGIPGASMPIRSHARYVCTIAQARKKRTSPPQWQRCIWRRRLVAAERRAAEMAQQPLWSCASGDNRQAYIVQASDVAYTAGRNAGHARSDRCGPGQTLLRPFIPNLKLPQTTGKLADVSKPSVFVLRRNANASAFFSCCPLRCYFHNSRNGRFISCNLKYAHGRAHHRGGWSRSASRRSIDRFRLITRVLHRSATGQQREALHTNRNACFRRSQCRISGAVIAGGRRFFANERGISFWANLAHCTSLPDT